MQVRGMPERFVVPGNRLAAATQVIADGACVQAEFRHHPVPGPPVAREAMQHHERRRTLAAYFDRESCTGHDHFPHFRHAASSARRCVRSEEHTSELQSLMRISYAVFCLKKKKEPMN